ncbi:MAG: co-chaperone GroES [Candidatus Omnitrophica bacterium]|nr:co-chaperone GroES [Candidatus Omnitrophota bacterium]
MAIQPLGDRIVIKLLEQEEKTKGGIILPDVAKEKPQEGKIVAVGKGRLLDNGSTKPLEVRVGDRILFARYSGSEVTHGNDELLIVKEDDILAVVKN